MTWPNFSVAGAILYTDGAGKKHKTHCYEAVSSALNFPFLKKVSLNCFFFDVVNFGSLADFFRFGAVSIHSNF